MSAEIGFLFTCDGSLCSLSEEQGRPRYSEFVSLGDTDGANGTLTIDLLTQRKPRNMSRFLGLWLCNGCRETAEGHQ